MNKSPYPIILSRPHGGLGVPPEIEGLLAINDISLYNECDLWIDQLFDFSHSDLYKKNGSVENPSQTSGEGVLASVSMPIARGLIDVNRPLRMLGEPDGPVKTRTSYGEQIYHIPLSDEQNQLLIARYWQAYHTKIENALEQNFGDVKLFIDCHNMAQYGPTKYRDAGKPRPLICIANLGDSNGEARPEYGWTFTTQEFAQKAVDIAWELFEDMVLLETNKNEPPPPVALLNQPFGGSYVVIEHLSPAKIAENYTPRNVKPPAKIMIEVNRGLYVGNQTRATSIAPPNEERISEIRKRLFIWAKRLLDFVEG